MPKLDPNMGVPDASKHVFNWNDFEQPGVLGPRDEEDPTGGLFAEFQHWPKKRAFLLAYSECGVVGIACTHVGITRQATSHWRRTDPEFAKAFKHADQLSGEVMVDALARRAIHGLRRLKFDKDGDPLIDPETGQPYEERQYSDVGAIFLIKGKLTEQYGERVRNEMSGEVNCKAEVSFYLPDNGRGPQPAALEQVQLPSPSPAPVVIPAPTNVRQQK